MSSKTTNGLLLKKELDKGYLLATWIEGSILQLYLVARI